MPVNSTSDLISQINEIENRQQSKPLAALANGYAYYHQKLVRFNQASFGRRILMGGFLRRWYLKVVLDSILHDYLWESNGW